MTNEAVDRSYVTHVAKLKQALQKDQALREAIGGEFIAIGALQRSLLISLGLKSDSWVVDVGCGSGRLACQLAPMKDLHYVGIDVVSELLEYAAQLAERKDWEFLQTRSTDIPCADQTADFVCFFSVFTHLSHEDVFRYLREAKRILKPGGRIVFSFLEFRILCHWIIFEDSVKESLNGLHVNQFMDRDGIRAWAVNLGLRVISVSSGDRPHIPIFEEIKWDNGGVMRDYGNLGQSVAVLGFADEEPPASPVENSGGVESQNNGQLAPAQPVVQGSSASGGFTNISTRGFAGPNENTMIIGFSVPSGGRKVLVRALGDSLKKFGIENTLKVPWIEIVDQTGKVVGSNFGLYNAQETEREEIISVSRALNAPPLLDKDAALIIELPEGNYSTLVRDLDGGSGVVLAEVFVLS
ncbi:MAG: class I SAM-dependent methyltransferase [Undibacterium sp.]|nr:class I SAM-dependent methyltransferase [Opitutaceae bacterium]